MFGAHGLTSSSDVKVLKRPLMPAAAMLETVLSSAVLLQNNADVKKDHEAILVNGYMPTAMVLSPRSIMYCAIDQSGSTPMVSLKSRLGPHNAVVYMHGNVTTRKGKLFVLTNIYWGICPYDIVDNMP